jgi:hypothetical protein
MCTAAGRPLAARTADELNATAANVQRFVDMAVAVGQVGRNGQCRPHQSSVELVRSNC